MAACGPAEEPIIEGRPAALLPCELDGTTRYYDFEQMNETLELNPQLADYMQLDRVESCESARDYSLKFNLFQEETYFERPLPELAVSARELKDAAAQNLSEPGILEIGSGCNGILINERAILTAAHCVDGLVAPARNGWANITIKRYLPAEDGVYQGQVRINIHPDFSGEEDAADDLAVIKLLAPAMFPEFALSDRTRIFTGFGSVINTMRLYGRGPNNENGTNHSIQRYMNFTPDWWGPKHFLQDAGVSRTCEGDSGGPTIDWTPSGHRVVAGIHSNSEKWPGDICARENGKMRSNRLADKIEWIEDMIDVDCTPFTDDDWSYVRCF